MDKKTKNAFPLTTVLFLIFLVLKLTNNIDWSWWWVTSPLWVPLLFVVVFGGIFILVAALISKK